MRYHLPQYHLIVVGGDTMLPDFPSLKDELHQLLKLAAQSERTSAAPFIGALGTRSIYEGDHHLLVRKSGEKVEGTYERYTTKETVELTEGGRMTLAEAYAMYRNLMNKMDDAEMAAFIELADKTAESVGNVVEGKGRPLPEVILEGIEKMDLLFAPENIDQLLDSPQLQYTLKDAPTDAIEEAREQMKREPYKALTVQLLELKREEHRARESSRKLVG